MEETVTAASKRRSNRRDERKRCGGGGHMEEEEEEEEQCDVEAWDTLSRSFKRAQVVLDQNRQLIERVNENHRSRIPDNLASNVSLINEINGNISKVLEIYSDLSANFTNIVYQRRRTPRNGGTTTTTTTTSTGGGRSTSDS